MIKYITLDRILILAILILLLFQQECTGGNDSVDTADTSMVIHNHYDSTINNYYVKNIHPVDSIQYSVPVGLDSMAVMEILNRFFAAYIYKDTIRDSSIVAMFHTTVKQNRIDSLGFSYKWIRPVRTEIEKTITQEKYKLKVFAGGFAGASLIGIKSFGPEVFLVTPKDNAYKANYNILDQSVSAGAYWKLSFKKKK